MNQLSKLIAATLVALSVIFSTSAMGAEPSCEPKENTYQKCAGIILYNEYNDRTVAAIYIHPVSPEGKNWGKNWLPWKNGLLPLKSGKIDPPASVVCPDPDSGPHLIRVRVTYKENFDPETIPSIDGCKLTFVKVSK